MTPQKIDLLINCPICKKIPYYIKRYDEIKCKTCNYNYKYYHCVNEICFSIKFDRKYEIVYVRIKCGYDNTRLQKYIYTIDFIPKNNSNYIPYNTYYYCFDKNAYDKNKIYLESDIFLNKKQINKIIDKVVSNQIFA